MDGIGGRCGDIMKHLREFAKRILEVRFMILWITLHLNCGSWFHEKRL